MKTIFKFLGIITFIAIIGFSMTACGEDEDNGGLTITGLNNYNGKYVVAIEGSFMDAEDESNASGLVAAAKIDINNENITCGKISGGSVTLKVWTAEENGDDLNLVEYRGNDTTSFIVVILTVKNINANTFSSDNIYDILSKLAGMGSVDNVTFRNGIASGQFSVMTSIPGFM